MTRAEKAALAFWGRATGAFCAFTVSAFMLYRWGYVLPAGPVKVLIAIGAALSLLSLWRGIACIRRAMKNRRYP